MAASNNHEATLKIVVGVVVGLFLLDRVVLTPGLARWKAQGERIADLREKVTRGRQLLEREASLRARWAEMQRLDMNEDNSVMESDAFNGWAKWAAGSRVVVTSITPSAGPADESHTLFELRASTLGTQAQLGQLMYALETDKLPVKLEEVELSSRDTKGQQIAGNLRFSFIRLKETTGK